MKNEKNFILHIVAIKFITKEENIRRDILVRVISRVLRRMMYQFVPFSIITPPKNHTLEMVRDAFPSKLRASQVSW